MGSRGKTSSAFSPVTGGAFLAYRGGMTNRLARLPYVCVGANTYISVRSWDPAFRAMTFGTSKPEKEWLPHSRCCQALHHMVSLQAKGDGEENVLVTARDVETGHVSEEESIVDPMAAADADRATADAGKQQGRKGMCAEAKAQQRRAHRRNQRRKRKAQQKSCPPKPLTVQFPMRPNGDIVKQLRVLDYETRQRAGGARCVGPQG